jgi:hypothetical protein
VVVGEEVLLERLVANLVQNAEFGAGSVGWPALSPLCAEIRLADDPPGVGNGRVGAPYPKVKQYT